MKISFGNEAVSKKWAVSAPVRTVSTNTQHHKSKVKQDSISISGQARRLFNGMNNKSNSLIDNLMKQRESLIEMKSKLTERTLDQGGALSNIKEQLKEFDKQIAEIDAQIAQQQIDERNKALGRDKEGQAPASTKKSDEERLITKATSLEHADKLNQVSNSLKRQINTLKIEIKQDAGMGAFIERKQNTLMELEHRVEKVQGQMQEKLAEQVNPNEKKQEEENQEYQY